MLSVLLQVESSSGGSDVDSGSSYFGLQRHEWAWAIGTGFAITAILISLYLIYATYRRNAYRLLRRYILLILFMVPVYSAFAWLGLVLKNQTAYWDLVRQCYESVAIWAFYDFLAAFMGGRQHMAAVLEAKQDSDRRHLFPLCCLPTWSMHVKFYRYSRLCVVQYIPVQLVCSIIIFVTSLTGQYNEGNFSPNNAYIYLAFTINCSQIVALYGLVEFYQTLKPDLVATRPFMKFLCIKGVVFFTFWQSVFLSMLVAVGVIKPTITYSTSQESYGIDDFLIVIEMLFFAIAHWYAWPPGEFEQYTPPDSSRRVTRQDGEKTEVPQDEMDAISYGLSEGAKDPTHIGPVGAADDDTAEPAVELAYIRKTAAGDTGTCEEGGGGGSGRDVVVNVLPGAATDAREEEHKEEQKEPVVVEARNDSTIVEALPPRVTRAQSEDVEMTDVET